MSNLSFNEYQRLSQSTAVYPKHDGFNIAYPVLGLAGEAGEVANEMKKVFRNDNGVVTPERLLKFKDELGDVFWYIAALATELGLDLEEIASYNLVKLQKRKEEGELLVRKSDYTTHPKKESEK